MTNLKNELEEPKMKTVQEIISKAIEEKMELKIDENLTPSTDVDLFRIQIWDIDNNDEPRYDNQLGAEEDAEPTTEIGGGSIVIHEAKGKK